MDNSLYEYQSYTIIRRRSKDRGSLCARLRREKGTDKAKLQLFITTRSEYKVRSFCACVQSEPFALPTPCPDQNP